MEGGDWEGWRVHSLAEHTHIGGGFLFFAINNPSELIVNPFITSTFYCQRPKVTSQIGVKRQQVPEPDTSSPAWDPMR